MDQENLIKLTFENALIKHKKLVEKFIWLLRNSETDMSECPINDIGWFYSYIFRKDDIPYDIQCKLSKMELNKRLEFELKYVEVSFFMVTPNFSIMNRLTEIPKEIKDLFRKMLIQKIYVEKFFDFEHTTKDDSLSLKVTADVWDDCYKTVKDVKNPITIEELKENLQDAIDNENYEEASKIQKKIDNLKSNPI